MARPETVNVPHQLTWSRYVVARCRHERRGALAGGLVRATRRLERLAREEQSALDALAVAEAIRECNEGARLDCLRGLHADLSSEERRVVFPDGLAAQLSLPGPAACEGLRQVRVRLDEAGAGSALRGSSFWLERLARELSEAHTAERRARSLAVRARVRREVAQHEWLSELLELANALSQALGPVAAQQFFPRWPSEDQVVPPSVARVTRLSRKARKTGSPKKPNRARSA